MTQPRDGSRFTELVGCERPIQLAGMGGSTTVELALAVARAGGLGMLSGAGGAPAVASLLAALPEEDTGAVGVNFLVPFLDVAALDAAARRCRVVEAFWGPPDAGLVARIHDGGARAAWQVGSSDEAVEAIDAGCDLVVVQGVEAGGHVRGTEPLLALLPAVRARVGTEVVLVAAGGLGTADDVAAAFAAGADAVRIGTRFLAATESDAHPDYVERLIRSKASDTVLTTAFGQGWPDAPHRVLRSAVDAGTAKGAAQWWTPNWPTVSTTGPVDAMALYAGLSVGAVSGRQSASAIIDELLAGDPHRRR